MNVRNEIKAQIIRAGMTMQEVVDLLSDEYGYMDEKGKNLATKEDIEEITRKTEEVQQEFREGFELFSNDVKFKYIQSSKEIIARKKKSIKHLSGRD